MTALAFTEWVRKRGLQFLFIQPGKPNQNGFVERFNRSLRGEVLDARLFNARSEVQDAINDWLGDYNVPTA